MSATSRPLTVMALAPSHAQGIFPPDLINRLRVSVECDPAANLLTSAQTVLEQAEILITGWECPPLDAELLARAPRLRAVIHAAGTVKSLVTEAVFARGIAVSSAAAANAGPVAEYTVATIVLSAKRAFLRASGLTAKTWAQDSFDSSSTGLHGCTIGIVGASRIGRRVLELLRSYEVRCLVADPYLTAEEAHALGARPTDLDSLCRESDIVSLHAPQLPETHHLLDRRRIGILRPGAVVINSARGTLIDTAALTERCATGQLDAVLDVTEPEPLPAEHPLYSMPNVWITPHLAGAQGRELRVLGEFAVSEVERFLIGRPLLGRVTAVDLARVA